MFQYRGNRFSQNRDAETQLEQVQGHSFTVTKVNRKGRTQPAAATVRFDFTELQRTMNRRLEICLSADATLKAAQALYEAKLITYPRTDSRYVGSDMKQHIPGIFRQLRVYRPREWTNWIWTHYHLRGVS